MINVLIVEDDPMVAEINQQYVQHFNNLSVINVINSGTEALKYLKEHSVDLLILDVYLPGMSGIELLKHLNEQEINIPTIMITAANDTVSVQKALQYGIIDYLVKPFTMDRFKSAIKKFLALHTLLHKQTSVDQASLDEAMYQYSLDDGYSLEKGLQENTLAIIQTYLGRHTDVYLTIDDIAEATNLSKITVRKYLNYLIKHNQLVSKLNYRTNGRPSFLYKYIN